MEELMDSYKSWHADSLQGLICASFKYIVAALCTHFQVTRVGPMCML
jgi:hypothetical protein